MHLFYEKSFKVELYSSKTIFLWPSPNFAIIYCKMNMTFESGHDILFLES